MVKKHEPQAIEPKVEAPNVESPKMKLYFFPSVGNGVSLMSVSQEAANEEIKKHPLYPK